MTAKALRVKSTPMAPYIGVMQKMNRSDIRIVMSFLSEIMQDSEEDTGASAAEDDEYLAMKMSQYTVSPETEELFGQLTEASRHINLDDERTKYMLGL